MSEPKVKDAFAAMDIARQALEKARVVLYSITSARKENNAWLVEASIFFTRYIVRIDANTGDVIELTTRYIPT